MSIEMTVAVGASVALHAVWLAREAKASFAGEQKPAEVLIDAETVRTPAAPEPKEEPKAEEKKDPAPVVRSAAPRAQAAPPAAAQAGRTLTAPDTPGAPAALADFTMVQGSGDTYAGGTTTALGTSAVAVRGPASDKPAAAPRAAAAAATVSGPDLSRGATPAASDWNCSRLFPNDPDAGDQAVVLIAVTVLETGAPRSAAVLRDPGHGFGAAAKACAMGQRFQPALDRNGSPIAATTPPIAVRFTR
jgi:protein TonB